MPLKFVALYSDNTILEQNDEDKSIQNPTKSCFYDINHDKLIAFALRNNDPNNYKEYTVNLKTGEFLLNGISLNDIIFTKDKDDYDFSYSNIKNLKLRLIYFKKNNISFTDGIKTNHNISYLLGWQTTDTNGCNLKRILTIK
jgi:hypothetical protein